MTKFHLINSALGGMGKSLFSQVLIHIHESHGIPYVAFDADTELLNVYDRYPATTYPLEISVDQFHNTDVVYHTMQSGQSIVVNLAASSTKSLELWLQRDGLLEMSCRSVYGNRLPPYQFVNWFLSDGSPASITKFQESVTTYGDRMTHVLVRNLGKSSILHWHRSFQQDGIQALLNLDFTSTVEFPKFIKPLEWDNLSLTFAQAMSCQGFAGFRLLLLDRQRVSTFVQTTYRNLKPLGLLADSPLQPEPATTSRVRQAIDHVLSQQR